MGKKVSEIHARTQDDCILTNPVTFVLLRWYFNFNSFHLHSPCPTHLLGLAVVIASNRRIGLLPCDVALGGTLLHMSCQLVICNVVVVTVRTGTRTM